MTVQEYIEKNNRARIVFANKNGKINGRYVFFNNTIYIYKNNCPHTLLHEFCHSKTITWQIFLIDVLKCIFFGSAWKSEFLAESMVRKLCRENGWNDVLQVSDKWLNRCLQYPWSIFHMDSYKVMAKKIYRKENKQIPQVIKTLFPWNYYLTLRPLMFLEIAMNFLVIYLYGWHTWLHPISTLIQQWKG